MYCQAIRDTNKQKQLDWYKKRIEEKEAFNNVIFTKSQLYNYSVSKENSVAL